VVADALVRHGRKGLCVVQVQGAVHASRQEVLGVAVVDAREAAIPGHVGDSPRAIWQLHRLHGEAESSLLCAAMMSPRLSRCRSSIRPLWEQQRVEMASRMNAGWDLSTADPTLVAILRRRAAIYSSPSKPAPPAMQQSERPHVAQARAALVALRNKLQVRRRSNCRTANGRLDVRRVLGTRSAARRSSGVHSRCVTGV